MIKSWSFNGITKTLWRCQTKFRSPATLWHLMIIIQTLRTSRLVRYYLLTSESFYALYYTHFEIAGGPCNLIGSNWSDLFTNKSHHFPSQWGGHTENKTTNQISRLVKSIQSNCRKMKDKEYHVANSATFVSKTLVFPPPKMDEFNFKLAQYCINEIFELTKSCIWAISKWLQ